MSTGDDVLAELDRAARQALGEAGGRRQLDELKRRLAAIERQEDAGAPTAEVVTAVPLTRDERAEFERRLRVRYGADVPMVFRVDQSVLGGAVVRVGDKLLDGSAAARLAQLRESLLGARD